MTARDRGAALLLGLALMQVLMAVTVAGSLVAALVVERARIGSVADVAVLAAAGAVEDPCSAADAVAQLNGLVLAACARAGPDVVVTVRGSAPGSTAGLLRLVGRPDAAIEVSARAGFP